MKKMLKLVMKNSGVFITLFMLQSCNKYEDSILRSNNDQHTHYIIKYKKDTISIIRSYSDGTKSLSKRSNYLKKNNSYIEENNRKPFFSTDFHKYSEENYFSLLDDSIYVGVKHNELYCTEVRSNKKPIKLKYFYDRYYNIKKIVFLAGEEVYIYE